MKKILLSSFLLVFLFSFLITLTSADEADSFSYLKNAGLFQSGEDFSSLRPQGILRYKEGIDWILQSYGTSIRGDKANLASYLKYFEEILERKMNKNFRINGGFRSDLFIEFLFRVHKIFPTKEQFLNPTLLSRNQDNPFLALSDLLNMKPSKKVLTRAMAFDILHTFLELQPYLLLDGYYGKIASHEHYKAKGNLENYFAVSSALGFEKTLFFPTGGAPNNKGYEKNQAHLLEVARKYPDRIVAFCSIDEQDDLAPQKFEDCVKQGGRGLKLLGGHPDLYDEPLNSEKMMKVYQKASELKLPIVLHGSIINIHRLEQELREVYGKFPDITFVHAHYCSTIVKGVNLEICGKILDDFPNVNIDLTMGGGLPRYLGYFENPADLQETIDFIIKYQDRITVSSDIILGKGYKKDNLFNRFICDLRIQQNNTYSCPMLEPEKKRNGFALPSEILRKLYYENSKRIFGF